MRGFGILTDMDKYKEFTSITEAQEPIEDTLPDEIQKKVDNVRVPMLDDDVYQASGSAGNTPTEKDNEKEAQLGAVEEDLDSDQDIQLDGLGGGIGGSLKKEMTRMEAFEGDEVTDEAPMDLARDTTTDNVVDRVDNLFTEMFGQSYMEKCKEKDYDLDATKPMVTTEEPIKFKVKRGW